MPSGTGHSPRGLIAPSIHVDAASKGVAPGTYIKLKGHFRAGQDSLVEFTDPKGNQARVTATQVTTSYVVAVVPPIINAKTGNSMAARVRVSVEQGVQKPRTVLAGLNIADLPKMTSPPGASVASLLARAQASAVDAINNYRMIDAGANGAVHTSIVTAGLAATASGITALEDILARAQSGPIALATLYGTPTTLDPSALHLLDRILATPMSSASRPRSPAPALVSLADSLDRSQALVAMAGALTGSTVGRSRAVSSIGGAAVFGVAVAEIAGLVDAVDRGSAALMQLVTLGPDHAAIANTVATSIRPDAARIASSGLEHADQDAGVDGSSVGGANGEFLYQSTESAKAAFRGAYNPPDLALSATDRAILAYEEGPASTSPDPAPPAPAPAPTPLPTYFPAPRPTPAPPPVTTTPTGPASPTIPDVAKDGKFFIINYFQKYTDTLPTGLDFAQTKAQAYDQISDVRRHQIDAHGGDWQKWTLTYGYIDGTEIVLVDSGNL